MTSDPDGPKVDIPDELLEDASSEAELASEPSEAASEPSEAASEPSEAASEPPADAAPPPSPEAELAELNDKYLRLAAEFENFKRRTLRERQDLLNYGTENLIKELLATVDNLERALGHVEQGKEGVDSESLSEGVELTHRSLLQALERAGLRAVEAEGASFDPRVHEALRQVPSADREPGTIIEIYQKGYKLKDRLLRPALVAVSGHAEKEND